MYVSSEFANEWFAARGNSMIYESLWIYVHHWYIWYAWVGTWISLSFTKLQAKQDLATAIREEKQASEA